LLLLADLALVIIFVVIVAIVIRISLFIVDIGSCSCCISSDVRIRNTGIGSVLGASLPMDCAKIRPRQKGIEPELCQVQLQVGRQ
jgi:hypothetical protein